MRYRAFLLFFVFAGCADKATPAPASTGTTPTGTSPGATATASPPGPGGALDAPDEAALSADDIVKHWEHVTLLNQQKRIFRGMTGFYAFTSRTIGGKGPETSFDALYQSNDGATWHRLSMLDDGSVAFSAFDDVAFGNGGFVAGGIAPGGGKLSTSNDGTSWPATSEPAGIRAVARVHGLFIAGNAVDDFQTSADGKAWTTVTRPLMQMNSAAYGNGSYVVFGSCGMMMSTNGTAWTDTTPSCSVVGAPCVSPPGGGAASASTCAYLDPGFFGAGKFFAMNMSSADGTTWAAIQGRTPTASAGGYLFDDQNKQLRAWLDGQPPTNIAVDELASAEAASGTEPDPIAVTFPDNATCNDHRCVVVGGELYLLH